MKSILVYCKDIPAANAVYALFAGTGIEAQLEPWKTLPYVIIRLEKHNVFYAVSSGVTVSSVKEKINIPNDLLAADHDLTFV
jgi:hypothetical protein